MKGIKVFPKEELWKQLNAELGTEFDRYVLAHPEVLDDIPDGAVLCFQLEGDEAFNRWSQRLAQKMADSTRPIVYAQIMKLKPPQSRIAAVKIASV